MVRKCIRKGCLATQAGALCEYHAELQRIARAKHQATAGTRRTRMIQAKVDGLHAQRDEIKNKYRLSMTSTPATSQQAPPCSYKKCTHTAKLGSRQCSGHLEHARLRKKKSRLGKDDTSGRAAINEQVRKLTLSFTQPKATAVEWRLVSASETYETQPQEGWPLG